VILISFVGFANLGGLNVVAVAVIGRGERFKDRRDAHMPLNLQRFWHTPLIFV
jgi:hypothetical protein